MRLVDSHVHPENLPDCDLETLARFGVEQVLVCAHDGSIPRRAEGTARDWLTHFAALLGVEAARLRRHARLAESDCAGCDRRRPRFGRA